MSKSIFRTTLRNGLDPKAPVLLDIGKAGSSKEAEDMAYKFLADPANLEVLGSESFYVRRILYSAAKPVCIGLDYGSHRRSIFIEEETA